MRIKIQFRVCLLLFLCCLLLSALAGCGRGTQYVGTYVAEIKDSPDRKENILELKETGAGVWKVGDDEVSFSWYVKGNELRLYTKNGGVIVGNMVNRIIHITLPGSQELFFRKIK
jgi:hypothetical protein